MNSILFIIRDWRILFWKITWFSQWHPSMAQLLSWRMSRKQHLKDIRTRSPTTNYLGSTFLRKPTLLHMRLSNQAMKISKRLWLSEIGNKRPAAFATLRGKKLPLLCCRHVKRMLLNKSSKHEHCGFTFFIMFSKCHRFQARTLVSTGPKDKINWVGAALEGVWPRV